MADPADLPEPDRRGDFPHPRQTLNFWGQQAAEDAFISALAHGRLHHAWLIQGPPGIGKATFAYRIARYILAHGNRPSDNLDVSPDHSVVRQISARAHPDLLVLNRPYDHKEKKLKSVITIDEVRRAGQFFSKTAGAGGWRVAILDCAEDMNNASANALLKTLEEPPGKGLFLVISHAPGGLLPTIRSRCRALPLIPLADDIVRRLVQNLLPSIGDDDLDLLVDLAEGSAGKALSLAGDRALNLYREMSDLLAALPKLDPQALHSFADKIARPGDDGDQFRLTGDLLSQWLVRQTRRKAREGARSLDRWVEVWEKTSRLFERADAVNLSRKQVLLDVFLGLQTAARNTSS